MTHAAIMRSLMAEWTGKRAEVRGRTSACEAGRQAIARLFFWL
jgi:hypothetical protein